MAKKVRKLGTASKPAKKVKKSAAKKTKKAARKTATKVRPKRVKPAASKTNRGVSKTNRARATAGRAMDAAPDEIVVVARDVPETKVDVTIEGFKNAGATRVTKTKQDDGKYTITAYFDD